MRKTGSARNPAKSAGRAARGTMLRAPRARKSRNPLARQIAERGGPAIDQRHPARCLQRGNSPQIIGQTKGPTRIAQDRLGLWGRAKRTRRNTDKRGGGVVQIGRKGILIGKSVAIDIPTPGHDHRIQRADQFLRHRLCQWLGNLMGARRFARGQFAHDIAPELQPHFRNDRFGRHPRGAADLDVEGVERQQHTARRNGRGHACPKAIRIAARDQLGTRLQAHDAKAPGPGPSPSTDPGTRAGRTTDKR